jgi:N-acetylneuraminic acid mutarotase
LYITFLCYFFICFSNAWEVVPVHGNPPSIRSWPAISAFDDGLLSFGGLFDDFSTGNFTFYNDLRKFDPETNTWTKLFPNGPIPSERMTTARSFDRRNNRFYFYGGTKYTSDFSQVDIYSDFWYYDMECNQWTEIIAANNGPGARTGAVMTIHGNKLYLFGGLDAYFGGKSDIWAFNLQNNRWTELIPNNRFSPRPTGMQYSPFHFYRGSLIVGAGEGGAENSFGFVNEWWKFNLDTRKWTQFQFTNSYGVPRNYIVSALYSGKIIIYGGDTPSNEPPCCGAPFPQNPTNETWVLNLRTLTWFQVSTPGISLKRHLGDVIDDQLYVAGGWGWNNNNVGQIWNPNTLVLDLDDIL